MSDPRAQRLSPAETAFLERRRVAHLATVDANGVPHVVPVCFALVQGAIYSVLDLKPKRGDVMRLRRVRNILANPRVAVVADVYDDDWTRLAFVAVSGRARLIGPGPDHALGLAALRERYPQYLAMALESRPMIVIAVQGVFSWGDLSRWS